MYIYIYIYIALLENVELATHPYKKARVVPSLSIKEDGDGTNHLIKEGGAGTPSLQGSIPPRRWR